MYNLQREIKLTAATTTTSRVGSTYSKGIETPKAGN